ncbi:MAG: alanyl-tRNA synthetase [Taibaiella sp.]|nr:alanyl-tRNA synthetase [Taibaiella sp.]
METTARQNKLVKWLRKLGFWGFMFFLAKGLAWLAIGYFVAR